MFEDIVGGVDKKSDDIAHVVVGDGIITCPSCGSDDIEKGSPVYLLNKSTKQRCDCKACNAIWSLTYDPVPKKYVFELHKRS